MAMAIALCISLSACGKGSDDEDSGLPHAIGYANESGIPYARPFITEFG